MSDTLPRQVIWALDAALEWAKSADTPCSNAAAAYIYAIEDNRRVGGQIGQSHFEADKVQFAYIISNLSGWRGPEAKKCRQVLKDYAAGKLQEETA